MLNSNSAFRIAAITGFLAVALGAFGAHGLHGLLEKNNTVEVWKTASVYHLVHAVVLMFVANRMPFARVAWILFMAGILLFSGSLYLLAVSGIRGLGAITPVGGVLLLAGWLVLAFRKP
ncbi:MAG: DUF423 domain-containing protein [Verrucomicrobiota bacterium]